MRKLLAIIALVWTASGHAGLASSPTAPVKGQAAAVAGNPPPTPAPAPVITISLTPDDREAISRVAFAEAGNQAEEGLAGVMFTILNRMRSWGGTAQDVVNSPGQFEPVTRAGGSWQDLPALSATEEVEAGTILDLILQSRLPDPTKGALYFQNPAIVAQRVADGEDSPGELNFGGKTPIAVIRNHAFYSSFTSQSGPPPIANWQSVAEAPKPHLFIDGKIPSQLASNAGSSPGLMVPLDTQAAQAQGTQSAPGLFVAVTTPTPVSEPAALQPSPGAIGN
jgi:spore germination cell wall hydrolase CwlJ-like protein